MERYGLWTEEPSSILERAKDFHGHIGPFLVIGVRAGLAGLRELQTTKESEDLSATALLTYSVPYSCMLDGIQVATGCTIGNKRLRFENSSNFIISFENTAGRVVAVSILAKALDEFRGRLPRGIASKEVERLAYKAASMAEEELFAIDVQ
ncbi:FmdE family protein [[Eubacterium] cellulosolvens]